METKKMILSSNGVKKILSNMGYSFKVELYMQNIIVSIWKDKYLFQKQYEYNVILEEIKGLKLISDFKVQLVKNHAFKKAFTYFMEEKNISLETQIPNSNIPLRITPETITGLQENEVFVFGSNEAGIHGAGAAKTALQWGQKMHFWDTKTKLN